MPAYLHPGVYLEEIPSGAKPIEGVATSITAFVGPAARGPVGEPVLIHSLQDYESTYGEILDRSDVMGFAATAFYQNGGRDAYICRVAEASTTAAAFVDLDGEATTDVLQVQASSTGKWGNDLFFRIIKPSTTDLAFTLEVGRMRTVGGVLTFRAIETYQGLNLDARSPSYALNTVNRQSLLVRLLSRGTLAGGAFNSPANDVFRKGIDAITGTQVVLAINLDGLGIKVVKINKPNLPGISATADAQALAAAIEAAVRAITPTTAPYNGFNAEWDDTNQRFLFKSSKSATASVAVSSTGQGGALAMLLKMDAASSPSWDGLVPKQVSSPAVSLSQGVAEAPLDADYSNAFDGPLKKIRDISVVVLPGEAATPGNVRVKAAVVHCEEMRNRVVILDPPPGQELTSAGVVQDLNLTTSTYATLYYPRVKVSNPFYDADVDDPSAATVLVAPSAFAAGMWSRSDGRRGVWKSPAGVETGLLGVAGLEYQVGDGDQDQLNPLGINCLRAMPTYGPVIWGARTLATNADPEWRYISVRRTAIMIEQSVYNGIQWAVFESNDHRLWASLRANIGSFMDGLFRAGAFQGEKASDAYFVRCGLGDTMTQGDVDRGQVIAIVGFAPLKPAEFVIVRIQQKVQQ